MDEDFAFDEVTEVYEMIAENLLRNEGTLLSYFDIFEQRQSEKCSSIYLMNGAG
ncbi:hypothetical protein [Ruminococcus albus]|uniref:hypothetical protein n=1 Tax=Ruminococcus albus TaxID=1264 RepID=UPI0003072B3F|nr:hypothetical protein [Ruminococcus albus]